MTDVSPGGPAPTSPARRPRRRPALSVFVGATLMILAADLITKSLALAHLADREPVRLLGGAVYLTLTFNSGAAFSIGAGHTWIFTLVTIAVAGWIGWLAVRLRSIPWAVALALVLGGALGNLVDRIFRAPGIFVGHVVDMVSLFHPYGQVWPVFNLADSALVVGVIMAVLLEFTGRPRDGTRLPSSRRARASSGSGDRAEEVDADRKGTA
jgi:signal peptidase II